MTRLPLPIALSCLLTACAPEPTSLDVAAVRPDEGSPSVSAALDAASAAIYASDDAAWDAAVIDVRVRVDALTSASAVLLGAMSVAEGRDEPRELGRFVAATLREDGGGITVTHPSGQPSRSVGSPSRGWLHNGVAMPDGAEWIVNHPRERYGTPLAVQELIMGFRAVARAFPDTAPVGVFDLSYAQGGPSPPHVSHESGRDVDITYYQLGDADAAHHFVDTSADTLDVPRQWQLLRFWLDRDVLTYVFIDAELQRALYRYARALGEDEGLLLAAFGDPRDFGDGIIRDSRGHDDHLHVRFRCTDGDVTCIP